MKRDGIQIGDIKTSQDEYVLQEVCNGEGCGNVLGETESMTGEDMYKRWTSLVMSAGFATSRCDNQDHRPTFSDLNISTDLTIVPASERAYDDNGEPIKETT